MTETQYFLHLAARLGYLSQADGQRLATQTKTAFACLHGPIKAVEAESGKLSRTLAAATSALVLVLARIAPSP